MTLNESFHFKLSFLRESRLWVGEGAQSVNKHIDSIYTKCKYSDRANQWLQHWCYRGKGNNYVCYLGCGNGFISVYIKMVKLYTLNYTYFQSIILLQ